MTLRLCCAVLLHIATASPAQAADTTTPTVTAATVCPTPAQTNQNHLYGTWAAQFSLSGSGNPPADATLRLGPHPELAQSVRGMLTRADNPAPVQVAGDVDDGDFTLEESANGRTIDATWIGKVQEGSCGKEIKGTWSNADDTRSAPFILRKQGGWQ
ncbi:MAG TPA: hypothetical protein VGC24_10780 [Burkholderiaceae bacterium]